MKLGINQIYFFPYIGYFQLMNIADEFIVYDNIEYSKGWINRNRILANDKAEYITVPLKKGSDYLDIVDRWLADSWNVDRVKMLNKVKASYRKAPQFDVVYSLFEKCVCYDDANLFNFLSNSLNQIKEYLGISTPLITSSTIPIDHSLKSENKVIALCKTRGADTYINPIGALALGLYDKNNFDNVGLELYFIKTDKFKYQQYDNDFVPFLSILDVMMFNTIEEIKEFLKLYTLVQS